MYLDRYRYLIVVAVPFAALVSWQCFDYIVPNLINVGPEWEPFQNGISFRRYAITLGLQSAVTLFSAFRLESQRMKD